MLKRSSWVNEIANIKRWSQNVCDSSKIITKPMRSFCRVEKIPFLSDNKLKGKESGSVFYRQTKEVCRGGASIMPQLLRHKNQVQAGE